uniref:Uncharacterized protein n=1 Tax=Anguilla anguilla TaxID=7936 RepID=A0A0E9T4Q5_ANGAN
MLSCTICHPEFSLFCLDQ